MVHKTKYDSIRLSNKHHITQKQDCHTHLRYNNIGFNGYNTLYLHTTHFAIHLGDNVNL